jgi:hypothetical protein
MAAWYCGIQTGTSRVNLDSWFITVVEQYLYDL